MSTLELPGSVEELDEILDDKSAMAAWNSAGRFGELVQRGIQLKAEDLAVRQQDEARAGGNVRRLDLRNSASDGAGAGRPDRHPLAYTAEAVRAVQNAIDTRGRLTVEADLDRRRFEVLNATLTTTTHGAPREWAASVLPGPRVLHRMAGVRTVPSDASEAAHSKLGLPTSTAASAEGATLAEYDSSTAGSVTLGRFGRFTDLSVESLIGTDAEAIVRIHQLGIAKDLDASLIGKAETDAGSAVAFAADVPAAIRKSIATLVDLTAAEDPADIFVLTHPDNIALLEDVTPVGGRTIGESFQQFSGATVYPSAEVTTGFMTVCNLRAGALFFEARGTMTEVDMSVKTGVRTVATSIIGGYGTGAIGSYAIQNDVVTP